MLGVVFFAVLAIVGVIVDDSTVDLLEVWSGELTNVVFAVFVIATIVVRRPFTLAYAKKQAPQEYWDNPLFLKINYVISGVWAAVFTANAVIGFIGDGVLHDPDNFWTAWVLQLATIFFALNFTEYYPDRATGDKPRAMSELFAWVPMFVLIAGIFALVTDALPVVWGIAMIAVGAVGNVWMGRRAKEQT